MASLQPPRVLIAIDTNVALDLALRRESVIDALSTVRSRLRFSEILIPPSVGAELGYIATHGEKKSHREAAVGFLQNHRASRFQLINYTPGGPTRVSRIAQLLLERRVLPPAEVHDAAILTEAALWTVQFFSPVTSICGA